MAKTALDKVGLILIGHGSKLPHNRENIEKLAETLRERSKFKIIDIAFMIRDTPSIAEAVDALAKRGVLKIVLVPAFLASGVHTTQDIPELIGMKEKESQLKKRGIDLFYGEPLGSDKRIAEILEEKALKALGQEIKQDSDIMDASIAASNPDVKAATAALSKLCSPLESNFAVISLSDLLTPWEKIERRLKAASATDFAIVLYNPKSEGRIEPWAKAHEIMLKHIRPDTPVGIVKQAGREGEEVVITTLKDMLAAEIDMVTTIIVGNSATKVVNGKMITARGYDLSS